MKRKFTEGDHVYIRYLPGDKTWELATYVRRIRKDEMPTLWRGPLGHVVELNRPGDRRHVTITGHRIRGADATRSAQVETEEAG